MKHLPLLFFTGILVISPWPANTMGIMEWAKKRSETTADTRRLEEDRRFQTETKETDSSEAVLQENIEAACEDAAFWLERQERLVEMEREFHQEPWNQAKREAILEEVLLTKI